MVLTTNQCIWTAKKDKICANGTTPKDRPDFDYEALEGTFGWFARGDRSQKEKRVPFDRPKINQILDVLPFVIRYSVYWLRNYRKRSRLFINIFHQFRHNPFYGVPCGGIGSGSIGRDFRGGFCKFALAPGIVEHLSQPMDAKGVVKADQFILTLSSNGQTLRQVVLSAVSFNKDKKKGAKGGLDAWDFSLSPENVTYRGLYPRSWTRFELPEQQVSVTMRQVSPVIPANYKDSSLPTTLLLFRVENHSNEALEVSITFTFRDGTAKKDRKQREGCTSNVFSTDRVRGVTIDHSVNGMRCVYALAASVTAQNSATVCRGFDPEGSGADFWHKLRETGELTEIVDEPSKGGALGVAVCLRTTVPAHSSTRDREMEFCLAWHMPIVHFGTKKRQMRRWYSIHFGKEPTAAERLAEYSLVEYRNWERQIEEWQNRVLGHSNLPDWFKGALFNELYFLTDGGSIWLAYDEQWHAQELQMSDYSAALFKRVGRFAYLESWEYRMLNTYDVHFYASFALAQLFPELEHSIQADIKDQIDFSDGHLSQFYTQNRKAPRKTAHRIPHDVGNPSDEPWLSLNAYKMHDTSKWKDLNLKFILTAYRDFRCVLLGNDRRVFLEFVWPSIKKLIGEALKHWDLDKDGMIENFGTADQTYDAWRMCGVSAYCGSLWLAALQASVEMAKEMGEEKQALEYAEIFDKARTVFESKLWNGRFYNFDERGECSRSIMADQLCGYWFLKLTDPALASTLLPIDHVKSVLETIYQFNCLKFAGGHLGVVNGMREDGRVDQSHIQADEVWTGVTYALGSFYIAEGQPQRGFDVAWGVHDACFNRLGLQYQTPEAIYKHRFYRAIGYMRPLAIWAMYWTVLDKRHGGSGLQGVSVSEPFSKERLDEEEDRGHTVEEEDGIDTTNS